MKKTILSIIFLVILLLVPTMVFAAEDVAQIGEEKFATLEEAVEVANSKGTETTITLLKNAEIKHELNITGNVKLNLNGASITPHSEYLSTHNALIIVISGGSLTIEDATGKGEIDGSSKEALYSAVQVTKKGEHDESKTTKLVVNGGTLKGYYYGISGNGTRHNTEIIINGGFVKGNSSEGTGIYHPQSGKLTITGGTIEGATGIEIRAGEIVVEGGTIIGVAAPTEVNPNGNGPTSVGAGIAVSQHGTVLPTSAVVKAGTIKGYTALHQSCPETNSDPSKVSLKVEGGNFEAINGGTNAVYSKDKEEFITGGTFNVGVAEDYIVGTVTTAKGENGETLVGAKHAIKIEDSANGKVTASLSEAIKGQTVTLTATPEEGYKLKSLTVITAADSKVTVTDGKFVMPDMGVIVTAEFEKIPVTTEENKEEKDETPKMGEMNISYAWVALAVIALVGIATTKKVSKHSK